MTKISAVYKIVNEVTSDFYVGSSRDVKRRRSNFETMLSKRNVFNDKRGYSKNIE